MRRSWCVVVITITVMFTVAALEGSVRAVGATERGLTITPLRNQATITAGRSTTGSFTVVNDTAAAIKVDLSIEKFAVKNGTYEYKFDATDNEWVVLSGSKQVELQPKEKRRIPYSVIVPSYAPSGGYYYALLASMDVPGSSISSELRVASLLYLTVDGGALSRASALTEASVPALTLSPTISYVYEAQDDGNVHFNVTNYTRLKGFLTDTATEKGAYILMPQSKRSISGTVVLPLLPGVYTLDYGFKDELGKLTTRSARIVYMPIWSIVCIVLVTAATVALVRRLRQTKS